VTKPAHWSWDRPPVGNHHASQADDFGAARACSVGLDIWIQLLDASAVPTQRDCRHLRDGLAQDGSHRDATAPCLEARAAPGDGSVCNIAWVHSATRP